MTNFIDKASLIMIPSAYGEGKLACVKPTDGSGDFTFTRASSALRTNPNGYLEPACYNLLQKSEELENGNWTKTNTTVTTNVIIDDVGNLIADKVIPNNGSALIGTYVTQNISLNPNTVVNFSFYAKPAGFNYARVFKSNYDSDVVIFDLINGVVSEGLGEIEELENGWYRCSLSGISTSTSINARVYPFDVPTGLGSGNGNGVDGIYVTKLQVSVGSTKKQYLKTTDRLNVPRLDYSDGATCPSVLLEPQRTNTFANSEPTVNESSTSGVTYEIFNWGNGFTNCSRFLDNSVSRYRYGGLSTMNVANTISVYVIMDDLSQPIVGSSTSTGDFVLTIGGYGIINTTITYESVGNNIWRVSGTATPTSSSTSNGIIKYASSPSSKGFRVVGWQLEVGSYASTYIPTSGTSVTRIADSFVKNNLLTENFIKPTGGTWVMEFKNNLTLTSDSNLQSLSITDTLIGTNNAINIISSPIQIRTRLSSSVSNSYTTAASNSKIKIAIKWNGTTINYFVNGIKVLSNGLFVFNNMEFLIAGSNNVPRNINGMMLFNEPLTDQECIELTTL